MIATKQLLITQGVYMHKYGFHYYSYYLDKASVVGRIRREFCWVTTRSSIWKIIHIFTNLICYCETVVKYPKGWKYLWEIRFQSASIMIIRRQFLNRGKTTQSVSQSVSQLVSQPVSQSVSQPVSQSVSQSASQPVSQSVSQSVSKSGFEFRYCYFLIYHFTYHKLRFVNYLLTNHFTILYYTFILFLLPL